MIGAPRGRIRKAQTLIVMVVSFNGISISCENADRLDKKRSKENVNFFIGLIMFRMYKYLKSDH